MSDELSILCIAAISVAVLHTIMGPDHYLPFLALAKSRGWTWRKTALWTIVCGCGHVWSSVLLGLGGAAIGWSLAKVSWLEGWRGGVAGWAMLGFGTIYGIWGLYRARREHRHFDIYEDGSVYVYSHRHGQSVRPRDRHMVTPWVLFVVFVLGPCEPMIPLLYLPAAHHSRMGMVALIAVYTICTLAVMLGMVTAGYYGLHFLRVEKLERYMHALGGLTLFVCGAGMVFMGW